jgi:PIN domain nuclease of toxin-antitoxin system
MSLLIDTHIWIWWLSGQKDLPEKHRDRLDRLAEQNTPPHLSAISLWEAQMLARKSQLKLDLSFSDWLIAASDPMVVRILPVDTSVVIALDQLPSTFHGDPADRMIVATALAHSLPLMTMDISIRKSRLVKCV